MLGMPQAGRGEIMCIIQGSFVRRGNRGSTVPSLPAPAAGAPLTVQMMPYIEG